MINVEPGTALEIRPLGRAEYDEIWALHGPTVFGDAPHSFRPGEALSDGERARSQALRERLAEPYRLYLGAFYGDVLAGWTWGFHETADTFYMVNSAVMPDFRGQGIYSALVRELLAVVIAQGFQKIYSRHTATNNAVLVPKLKTGFVITGLEISEQFGTLVHLSYFPNAMRRQVLDYRVGHAKPSTQIRNLLGY